eukprot:SAG31_NODE_1446_length_8318_cov_8.573914_13_plen_46_part_00
MMEETRTQLVYFLVPQVHVQVPVPRYGRTGTAGAAGTVHVPGTGT